MARPQSSPKGHIAKQRVDVGAQELTDGTTYLNLSGGLRISGAAGGLLTADAAKLNVPKAILPEVVATMPNTRVSPGSLKVLSNTTGVCLAINTTGTTWKYIQIAEAQTG